MDSLSKHIDAFFKERKRRVATCIESNFTYSQLSFTFPFVTCSSVNCVSAANVTNS